MTTIVKPTQQYFAVEDYTGPTWKPIIDFPNVANGYSASTEGEIRSPRGVILTPNRQGVQYWVSLRTPDGISSSARVDKLVLTAFAGYQPEKSAVHRNGDTLDCSASNLEWGEQSALERAAQQASQRRRRRNTRGRGKAKAHTPASKVKDAVDELEMLRVYRRGGIQVTVGADGLASLSKREGLTTAEMAVIAEIAARVVESNQLMGLA